MFDVYTWDDMTDGMVACESCGNYFDPDDIIGGRCAECAEYFMSDSDALLYAVDHLDEFIDWVNNVDDLHPDMSEYTLRQRAELYKDFAKDDFDHYRRYIAAKGGAS